MAYGVRQTEKVTLPSDKEYWVEIRTSLTYGELKRFDEYGGSDGPFTAEEKLKLIIVDWNLDNEAGEKYEVTPDNINLLQEDDVIAVVNAFNAKEETDDAKKNSRSSSTPTSPAQK